MIAATFLISLINVIIGISEFFIALRIILRLFDANAAAPFVAWVYDISGSLLWPFQGMFPTSRLEGGFVIEISAMVGLLVYAFLGYLLTEVVRYIDYHSAHYKRER